MSEKLHESGFAAIQQARLYYETAGAGTPFVMLHAGVADSRQWEKAFNHFAGHYRVVCYDLRGYGRSEPVEGEFSHLLDLEALLAHLEINQPLVLMGCSMGGGLAMNYALKHPAMVKGLIMVDSGPGGLELDVPSPAKFEEAEAAYKAGDLDRVAEIETQIWFDGMGRTPEQVNPTMRALAYEMNRTALAHDAKGLGKLLPDAKIPAVEQLDKLSMPVLVIVGDQDMPYIRAAADYMETKIPTARQVIIEDAAHLPNMDQPETFQEVVEEFLEEISGQIVRSF